MAVWYLDNDDEITDAVARLRSTSDEHVVFVVPPGSRIATGRINFKLLAREAASRDLSLAIASPDEQVRSLAVAAGVLGLRSADEAEAALERGDTAPAATEEAESTTRAAAMPELDVTVPGMGESATEAEARRRRRRMSIGVVVLLGLFVAGGIASLEVLPTGKVTIIPRTEALGPLAIQVAALPSISAVDLERRQVPAIRIPIPLSVVGTIEASGRESVETRATGNVIFSSAEQSFDQELAAGTRVETAAGVAFRTTAPAVLERPANGSGPAAVSAPIEAIEPGPEGNVDAAAISVVPSLASTISVTNPDATSGGDLQQTSIVTRGDYDDAAIDSQNRLSGELTARLRDPAIVPDGLTLFPETVVLGPVTHSPDPDDVVGRPEPEVELTSTATAGVLAVDSSLVERVAAESLSSAVPDGMSIDAATVIVELGDGVGEGQRIEFEATASGTAHAVIDPDVVVARVAGLPVSEARSILGPLGTVTVTVWPEFISALPRDGQRITLEIEEPS